MDYDLPGSFVYYWKENNIKCFAKTKYKLTAGFRDYRNSKLFYNKQELIIDQKHKGSSTSLTPPMFDQEVKNCFCKSHGKFKLAAIFGTQEMYVGDTIHCSVAVDATQAKTDIRNVKCELVMLTDIKAKGLKVSKVNTIQSLNLGPLKKGYARVAENSFAIDLQVFTPDKLQATSSGTLINNYFEIRVIAVIDGCVCCSSSPNSKSSLNVYNKEEFDFINDNSTMDSSMNNWKPQTFDPYICQFNSKFKMPEDFENNFIFKNPSATEMPTY